MGCVIALAGKGGTGKTTVAALVARIIKEKDLGTILAIDADPNSNLGQALGMEAEENIGQILDGLATHPESVPVNMGKDAFIEYRLQSAIAEGDGFDLLTMGRGEGPGCYCYVNNVLRNIMEKLIKDYTFTIIDNEAGFEHLSRRTSRKADNLVVVSDATRVGLMAAQRINALVKELKIKTQKAFLIVNRAQREPDKKIISDTGLEYLGSLAHDPQIEDFSFNGNSLMRLDENNISLNTLRRLGEKIWLGN